MAIRFDGSGDALTATTGLPGTTYTATLWGMLTADRNTWSVFWDLPGATGANASSWQYLGTDDTGTSVMVAQYPGTESSRFSMSLNQWYRLAVVRSGTAMTLYCAPATGSFTTITVTVANLTPAQLWVGRDSYSDEWLNGRIASFKMWNAALTLAEVTDEFTQYSAVRASGLLRRHDFLSSVTADDSGLGNTLTAGSTSTAFEDGPDIPLSVTSGAEPGRWFAFF